MGNWKESVCKRMQAICDCFSFAAKKAAEAEFDIPSKRRFRLRYAPEETDSALSQDAVRGPKELATRARVGVKAFLECLYDARKRADESKTDPLARSAYRKLPD